jgi:GTP-dependent phosphoenolpyruvate carboxykinase
MSLEQAGALECIAVLMAMAVVVVVMIMKLLEEHARAEEFMAQFGERLPSEITHQSMMLKERIESTMQ